MTGFKQELIKKLIYTFIILAVLGGGLIYLGRDVNQRAQKIKDQRQALLNQSEAISLSAVLKSQSQKAKTYLSVLENILPSRSQIFNFSKEMKRLANQEKIDFGFSFGAENQSAENQAESVSFDITARDSLDKILNFIKNMENSRFLIEFNNFDFAKQDNGMHLTINGKVYFK